MTFRTRLAIAMAVASLAPLVVFGFGVRRAMNARFDAQADRALATAVTTIGARLEEQRRRTAERLHALADELAADNRFRVATADGADRLWLLDWAPSAMATTGFAVLVVRDERSRIMSAGHFRNDFDRVADLPDVGPDSALVVRWPTATGEVVARVVTVPFAVAGRSYFVTGGAAFDSAAVAGLAPGAGLTVTLEERTAAADSAAVVASLPVAAASAHGGIEELALVVRADRSERLRLARDVDRWFLAAIGVTLAGTLLLAFWLAGLVSRPLADLAAKTERLDLERLDQQFATDRGDEIGALSRLLEAMTRRLRTGAARLRESERRATVGDLARQVNHDVKNGLAPIRHVVRHLGEVAERNPDQLPTVFGERRSQLESSIDYLDRLARTYAKLSPGAAAGPAPLATIARQVADQVTIPAATVVLRIDPATPAVRADEVALRRILENLVLNGAEALEGRAGTVTLASETVPGDPSGVRITVADTGRGMTREELARAFDDFYTTKTGGTGLGLSVVRRLVSDLGGSLRTETEPGQGTRITIDLPAA